MCALSTYEIGVHTHLNDVDKCEIRVLPKYIFIFANDMHIQRDLSAAQQVYCAISISLCIYYESRI